MGTKSSVLTVVLVLGNNLNANGAVHHQTHDKGVAASFVNDLVYVDMPTPSGRAALHLFTDSGGGSLLLTTNAAATLGLSLHPESDDEIRAELGPDAQRGVATPFMALHWPAITQSSNFFGGAEDRTDEGMAGNGRRHFGPPMVCRPYLDLGLPASPIDCTVRKLARPSKR
jgi:hypothetical protein